MIDLRPTTIKRYTTSQKSIAIAVIVGLGIVITSLAVPQLLDAGPNILGTIISIFLFLFMIACVFCCYFFPWLIASDKHSRSSIFVVNLFFGWTLIGWVVCLAWAVSKPREA